MLVPARPLDVAAGNDACVAANAVLVCSVPLDVDKTSAIWPRNHWQEVDAIHERATFKELSWLLERTRNVSHLDQWTTVTVPDDHSNCERCAPTPPVIEWGPDSKGKMVPAEDSAQAGRYEQALKHRPSPFVTHLKLDTQTSIGTLRLAINVPSLIHRALSRLPRKDRPQSPILSWRLVTDYTPPTRLSLPSFQLTSNKKDPTHDQPPNFTVKLRPEQLRSLHWMLERESPDSAPFVEEEISEAILKPIGWRVEGKAQRPVKVSGGVLADEVGYGKTAITLGLIDTADQSLPKRAKHPKLTPGGKIPTNASLVVVPGHLTRQWASEITKFMGPQADKTYNVVKIENMSGLNALTIDDILDADIILMASTLPRSDVYLRNLEAFSAGGTLPTTEGRHFDSRLKDLHVALLKQIRCLREDGAQSVRDNMKKAVGMFRQYFPPRSSG